MVNSKLRIAAAILAISFCAPVSAQVTQRVSVSSAGVQGNDASYYAAMTPDGRYVAFASNASNLVAGDTNSLDVFVRDRLLGTTDRVSVDSGGSSANGDCGNFGISISSDGRFVAFTGYATNLVPGDTNGFYDIFVHDRQLGTTERVSVDSSGAQSNDASYISSISADGRYVAFESFATNLVPGDTNGVPDIFVRDRQLGTTERVSVDSGGVQGNGNTYFPCISADGRWVTFSGFASNLVAGDTNGDYDVFVRDRQLGTTERVSVDSSGMEANGGSGFFPNAISTDGRFVVFNSTATNLVPGDTNAMSDLFVRDRQLDTTDRVSVSSGGAEANADSINSFMAISPNGRFVTFASSASNLVTGDVNAADDVFLRDRALGTTERLSLSSAGQQGFGHSRYPSVSDDGRWVAFSSSAPNLVSGDTNLASDVFVRDRNASGFTSLCDPGVGGVIACPCANPPGGPGAGCDNAAATGGASLTASGIAYLASDTLVFHTTGEKPTALSVLLQGTSLNASGAVYGQGVRCVGGILKRLFAKNAVSGSITVPNFGAGDPSVSARSAAKGNIISAGQSRWYLVFYRDPVVLGGCPSTSTFNATQSGRVDWSL
jgi:Tol biopolymer transport system component